jgi:hypothetical protein
LMALEGKLNGVIPDYIIFSDTGWEPKKIYEWIDKVNNFIKAKYNREIIFTYNQKFQTIQNDMEVGAAGGRMASLPLFLRNENGGVGMIHRQCTYEFKILPVQKKIRELLGYAPRKKVKEAIHLWKGISIDEIQRVRPSKEKWITAEYPLIDIMMMDRSECIKYVEDAGLGTPEKSSCIGCPYKATAQWYEMKENDPESWESAVYYDELMRNAPIFKNQVFFHKSCIPLKDIDFLQLLPTTIAKNQEPDHFNNECEGMCGL